MAFDVAALIPECTTLFVNGYVYPFSANSSVKFVTSLSWPCINQFHLQSVVHVFLVVGNVEVNIFSVE